MFLVLFLMCSPLLMSAMNTLDQVPLYQITKTVTFPDRESSGLATVLSVKNALCVARNDAQLALYDIATGDTGVLLKTPVRPCSVLQQLSPVARVAHAQCIDGNLHTKEQYYDFMYGESGRHPDFSKNHPRCHLCGFQASVTSPDVVRERDTVKGHSHQHMQPRAITSNETGTLICVAKDIHECAALELHTIIGKSADSSTLKNTISCKHTRCIEDLAYAPDHTCVSIDENELTRWDVWTGKATCMAKNVKKNGRLLSIDQNMVCAHGCGDISLVDMRSPRIMGAIYTNNFRINGMAQLSSGNYFLTGGEVVHGAHYNSVQAWDVRKMDSSECVATYPIRYKSGLSVYPIIHTIAQHNNYVLAAVTKRNRQIIDGTFLYIWDSHAPDRSDPVQTIKLSEKIEPNTSLSVLTDDRVLVTDSTCFRELTLVELEK